MGVPKILGSPGWGPVPGTGTGPRGRGGVRSPGTGTGPRGPGYGPRDRVPVPVGVRPGRRGRRGGLLREKESFL